MKSKFKIILALFCLCIFFYNCNENEPAIEQIDLSNLRINIDLKLDLGKEFKIENISDFIVKNEKEISNLEEDLILLFTTKGKEITYSINTPQTLQSKSEDSISTRDGDPVGIHDAEGCKTCRSRDCITSFIAENVNPGGNNYISITANYTLGVQTSSTVCISDTIDGLIGLQ